MSEYIKREDAIDAICNSGCPCKGEEGCVNKDCVVYNILKVSFADVVERPLYERALSDVVRLSVERKKGVWIGEADGYADGELVYDMWSCGCCGKSFDEWEEKPDWNFCPNCGAEMGSE